jgi:hypothetical protein
MVSGKVRYIGLLPWLAKAKNIGSNSKCRKGAERDREIQKVETDKERKSRHDNGRQTEKNTIRAVGRM